jgi:hypothetical protein
MYGRRVITTDVAEITSENVVEVLEEAMKFISDMPGKTLFSKVSANFLTN